MKTIVLTAAALGLIAAPFGFAQTAPNQSGASAAPPHSAIEKITRTHPVEHRPVQRNAAPTAQKSKASAEKSAAAQKANPPVTAIPGGAKLIEPNLYRYTDSNGKTWMYRQTPFGISRWEDTPNLAPHPAPASEPVSVTDLGDSVRFERQTAFGPSQWVRKKSELTEEEKALVANQQDKQAAQGEKQSEKKTPERQ
ncbi:MAG TPA: hypothetical protein VME17_21140 [Bryobacteraceae bacterium]|nr:hypothetical protein [Bryobacteraceae bacterium]